MERIMQSDPKQLNSFDLKQRCHIAVENIYRAPGNRKWLLYVLPLLEQTAAYKHRVDQFGNRQPSPSLKRKASVSFL